MKNKVIVHGIPPGDRILTVEKKNGKKRDKNLQLG